MGAPTATLPLPLPLPARPPRVWLLLVLPLLLLLPLWILVARVVPPYVTADMPRGLGRAASSFRSCSMSCWSSCSPWGWGGWG